MTAEIRDSTGEVVLRGTFMLVEEEDDDIERKAALAPTTGGEVMGEAEVEFATEMPADQEVEFAARGLDRRRDVHAGRGRARGRIRGGRPARPNSHRAQGAAARRAIVQVTARLRRLSGVSGRHRLAPTQELRARVMFAG